MKRKVIVLSCIALLLVACQSTDTKTLAWLDEGIVRNTTTINNQSILYFEKFEIEKIENPRRVFEIKKQVDSISNLQKAIETQCAQIIDELSKNENTKFRASTNSGKDQLFSLIENYEKLVSQNISADSTLFNQSKQLLDFSDYKPEKLTIPTTNLLLHRINVVTYYTLQYLYKKTKPQICLINKIEPVVIPQSKYVKRGQTYLAEIFITAIDTLIDAKVIIEEDTIPFCKGKALYTKACEQTGKYSIKGKLIYKTSPLDDEVRLPFETQYSVIK